MSNEYVLTPLSDLQEMADALKDATGNSGEMSYEDFKGVIINIKNEIGGGGGESAETVEIQLNANFTITDPEDATHTVNSYYINGNGEKTEDTHILSRSADICSIIVKKGTIFVLYSSTAMDIDHYFDSALLYVYDEMYCPLLVAEAVNDRRIGLGR
jgi:hypothetical protein